MSIQFQELAGSPVETYSPDGLSAQRQFICPWDDRRQVIDELLGDGYYPGGRTRAAYPASPDLLATRIRCEPLCDDVALQTLTELTEGLNGYHGYAKITVDYELLPRPDDPALPAIEPGTFLTCRHTLARESLAIPARGWKWKNNPGVTLPPDDMPSLRLPILDHQFTWHRVLRAPWQAIRHCAGAVNSAAFLGAAPGTVLFAGSTAQPQLLRIDSLGRADLGWQIHYLFRERTAKTSTGVLVGWNHAYRSLPADNPGWDEPLDANDNPPYRSADFSTLFLYEAFTP